MLLYKVIVQNDPVTRFEGTSPSTLCNVFIEALLAIVRSDC